MTSTIGNAAAKATFRAAIAGGSLHHAWLFAGPEGIGKAAFARAAAARMLAEASGEPGLSGAFGIAAGGRAAALIASGAHPDFRILQRLPHEKKPEELARSIPIGQVRGLLPLFATAPAFSVRRVVLIDAIDDVERPAASNALLKNLEEPPAGTIFLLISHAPGRLLPTIRSRCRLLRFDPLDDGEMRDAIRVARPDASEGEIVALVRIGGGSPGRALRYAGLDLAGIDAALSGIAHDGDLCNARRLKLAKALSPKAAQSRYEAFLDRAPSFVAQATRMRVGEDLRRAIETYAAARELAGAARGLSLDAHGTVIEMAGLVARLAVR